MARRDIMSGVVSSPRELGSAGSCLPQSDRAWAVCAPTLLRAVRGRPLYPPGQAHTTSVVCISTRRPTSRGEPPP